MDNKRVAKHALSFIGGKPGVSRYYNRDESKQIDIMASDSGVIKGVPTCATIGLNQTDIGLTANGKKLRVELMAVCEMSADVLGNILASISFEVMDHKACSYGMVVPEIVSSYVRKTDLKHVVLMSPVFWPKYKPLEDEGCTVVWLMAIPCTDAEKEYIERNGVDAFDRLLEANNADVISMSRKSVV